MNVAVPLPKHSWMFGQDASSQTVTSRFSRSFALSFATALPGGMRTRIHSGLRSFGASIEYGAVTRDLVLAELFFADDDDGDGLGGRGFHASVTRGAGDRDAAPRE